MLLDEIVEIKGYGLGRDDVLLGVIFIEEANVNLEMLRRGLARVSREMTPEDFDIAPYMSAQMEAKRGKRGIWAKSSELSPLRSNN